MKDIIKDFLGVFPNAATNEYCDKIINRFDYIHETRPTERGRTITRQEQEKVPAREKDDTTYFLGGDVADHLPLEKEDKILLTQEMPLLAEFNKIIWKGYEKYIKKYGTITNLGLHKVSPFVRVQKSKPSQGYHLWHSDAASSMTSRRMLVVTLYLNTIKKGGETEFLYQSTRVPPVQGTLVLFPAAWTHMHRGNPPLEGNKYLMTSWLEFVD